MSYDIWLEVDAGGPEPVTIDQPGNYTSNVSPMWRDALGDKSLRDFHHAPCSEAAGPLDAAVRRMEADPNHYRAMNPPNGWGDYEGALDYLRSLRDACAKHSKARIVIWA